MTSEMKALNCGLVSSNSWASKKAPAKPDGISLQFECCLNSSKIKRITSFSSPWGIVPIALIADGEDTFDVLINNL